MTPATAVHCDHSQRATDQKRQRRQSRPAAHTSVRSAFDSVCPHRCTGADVEQTVVPANCTAADTIRQRMTGP